MSKIGDFKIAITVDASGLNCPLPILKARKALLSMHTGQILKVVATDPTSAEDFPIFAKATGSTLLGIEHKEKQFIYYLEVG